MLYPKTISLPYGGNIFTASPNVAVNVAVTAGLFSLPLAAQVPPAMKIYAPYDQSSTVIAAKRLTTTLVALGVAIKAVHWVFTDEPDDGFPEFVFFPEMVVSQGSEGSEVFIVAEQELDNTLDLDGTRIVHDTLNLDDNLNLDTLNLDDDLNLDNTPSLDDNLNLDNTLSLDDTLNLANTLNLDDNLSLTNTLNLDNLNLNNSLQLDDTVELNAILPSEDIIGQDDFSRAPEKDQSHPNRREVIIFAGSSNIETVTLKRKSVELTSPLGYPHWLDHEVCDVQEKGTVNMTRIGIEDSLGLGFSKPPFSCAALPGALDFPASVIVQYTHRYLMAGFNIGKTLVLKVLSSKYLTAILTLSGILAILLLGLRVLRSLVSQYLPEHLEFARWSTADPLPGSDSVLVGEFWFRRSTMWRVNYLINMHFEQGSRILYPEPVLDSFSARPGNEVALYVLESLAVGTMWVSIKILGETACKEALERAFVEQNLPDHMRRYLRYLLYPKPTVDVSHKLRRSRLGRTGRRRARQKLERELFGYRVHKGYRRSITKMVASGVSLCALALYVWERGGSG